MDHNPASAPRPFAGPPPNSSWNGPTTNTSPPGFRPAPPSGPWAPVAPQPRPGPLPRHGSFTALFDFRFDRFAATGLIRLVYIAGTALLTLGYLAAVITAFSLDSGFGMITMFGGAAGALFGLAALRVTLEFYYALIRMSDEIHNRP